MKAPVCLMLFCLLPAAASASGFNYDYLDIGHERLSVQQDPSGFSADGSGSFAALSYTIFDEIQLRGSYDTLRFAAPADYTAKDSSFGVTGESQMNDNTDVYTDLLYLNDHYSSSRPIPGTDSGYRVAVGLRHQPWARLEVDGYVAHNYLTLASNEAGVSLLFNATPWLAVEAGYSHDTNYNNTTRVGLRLYF